MGRLKKNKQVEEGQGRSRGGLSTKIHAAVDSLGNPVRILLTGGNESEYGQASLLIKDFRFDFALADKGYDSDFFVEEITKKNATAVIPPRINRVNMREYDSHLYKERNLVERFFQKIKCFRRIATRYERLKSNYLAMLLLASTIIWLA